MKYKQLQGKFSAGFRVAFNVRQAQVAEMVIAPGGSEGGPDNRHRGADQWLYVVSGIGLATVNGVEQKLRAGSLLVIENGETHEVRNTGRVLLKTLNFYYPPAFDDEGEPLPAGES